MLSRVIFGSLLLVLASRASAQGDPTALPAPLVSALMAGQQYGAPSDGHYFVGTTPTGFPAALVPRSATVVGGMLLGTQSVAVFADTASRFLASYLQSLMDSGWKQPNVDQGAGFISSGGGRPGFLCRDSARVAAIAVPGALAGAFIHVTYQPSAPGSCPNQVRFGMPRATSQLELPLLTPPKGMRSSSSGSSSGGDDVDARVHLVGDTLSPSTILAHYATLLVAAGWTTDVPATAPTIGAQRFGARDKEGKTWTGILVVSVDGQARNASIAMHRTESK